MELTYENKGWMLHAIYLGEDNMILFSEKTWKWISEPMVNTPIHQQCNFYQKYVEFGGLDDLTYNNEEALKKTIEYADDKIAEAFRFIETHFDLYGED
tara:strand:- start:442 stop:735 length:294 start_codon:yes stop_codon:yes gene_type:complete